MCKPSRCCPGNDTGPGLGTAIAATSLAVVAIAALRVIETILWGLIIAALATIATILAAGIIMAWRYSRPARPPARSLPSQPVKLVALPQRQPDQHVAGAIADKSIAIARRGCPECGRHQPCEGCRDAEELDERTASVRRTQEAWWW